MPTYIALIHKDAESDYGVSFPDLPGLVTAGKDLDEARARAEEALAIHLGGMAEDDETVPEPSSLEAIMSNVENRDGVAILVDVRTAPKIVQIDVAMPEDVLKSVDRCAAENGMNRSGFLVHAAKKIIEAV